MDENNLNSVADVYTDRCVFVTGASGFLGKVLVEKLLYSTNVKSIYVLIRPLKGHPAKEYWKKCCIHQFMIEFDKLIYNYFKN